MDIEELIAHVENITSVSPGAPPEAIAHQQYQALSNIEGSRRAAHANFLETAFELLLANDDNKSRQTSHELAAQAGLYANAMMAQWDTVLLTSLKRGKELRDKFDLVSKQTGKKTEKH